MTAPTTPPALLPTKVTEVGRKCGGGIVPDVVVDSVLRCCCGIGALLFESGAAVLAPVPLALGCTDDGAEPSAIGGWELPGRLVLPTSWGTASAAAITTAEPAAATTACRVLRRRALCRIRSSEPGGGLSGCTSPPSQSSISSRGLVTGVSKRGLQAGPGVE